MNKFPASVKISLYDVPIRMLDQSDAEKNFGQFHPEHMEIKLRPNFSSSQIAADTLLHEIMHAIWHVAGCTTKDGEERLVATLASNLCAFIKDNPEAIKWLQGALNDIPLRKAARS